MATQLLLDSHIFLWWLNDEQELSGLLRDAIVEPANRVHVSAASLWELEIKIASGKLTSAEPLSDHVEADGFVALPVTIRHAVRAAHLPPIHADPFDRMLIAQAQVEGLTLVTVDRRFRLYDVPLMGL